MNGMEAGTRRYRNDCHELAPIDCVMKLSRGSIDEKPVTLFTRIGKNVMTVVSAMRGVNPNPNQTMRSGAVIVFGMISKKTINGKRLRFNEELEAIANPRGIEINVAMT